MLVTSGWYMQKKKTNNSLDTAFIPFTKINPKWVIDFDVKHKTIKFLEDNIRESPEISSCVQWLGFRALNAGDTNSVLCLGTKIPHTAWCGKEKKNPNDVEFSDVKEIIDKRDFIKMKISALQ